MAGIPKVTSELPSVLKQTHGTRGRPPSQVGASHTHPSFLSTGRRGPVQRPYTLLSVQRSTTIPLVGPGTEEEAVPVTGTDPRLTPSARVLVVVNTLETRSPWSERGGTRTGSRVRVRLLLPPSRNRTFGSRHFRVSDWLRRPPKERRRGDLPLLCQFTRRPPSCSVPGIPPSVPPDVAENGWSHRVWDFPSHSSRRSRSHFRSATQVGVVCT